MSEHESTVIVALPAVTTVLPHSVDERLHCTLAYIETPSEVRDLELLALVEQLAAETAPFDAKISGRGRLGDDDAAVLLLESDELAALHSSVEGAPCVPDSKFPSFIPHLSLGYGSDLPIESIDPATLPESITFDRLALWSGDTQMEFALSGGETETETYPFDDLLPLLETMPEFMAASGSVTIPDVDSFDDLAAAVQYAQENPAARWYVRKRAEALMAAVPAWEVPGLVAAAPPEDTGADADIELQGPGGVQAAASALIRLRSYGRTDVDFTEVLAAAADLGMMDDPLIMIAARG